MTIEESAGPSTDRHNDPVVDPTHNVLQLVEAAVTRLDDLRHEGSDHVRELIALRSHYDQLLSDKETERINAIRAVDTGAVTRAAEVSAAQASTLATQVAASAEALRGQVEAARVATETRLASALQPITASIEELRRTQYQQQGEKSNQSENRQTHQWNGSTIVAIAMGLFSTLGAIITIAVIHH